MIEQIKKDKVLAGLVSILFLMFIYFAYVAIEPIIFAYTGFGFVWDYNPDFEPILFRK